MVRGWGHRIGHEPGSNGRIVSRASGVTTTPRSHRPLCRRGVPRHGAAWYPRNTPHPERVAQYPKSTASGDKLPLEPSSGLAGTCPSVTPSLSVPHAPVSARHRVPLTHVGCLENVVHLTGKDDSLKDYGGGAQCQSAHALSPLPDGIHGSTRAKSKIGGGSQKYVDGGPSSGTSSRPPSDSAPP